jgi:hypothetical protein
MCTSPRAQEAQLLSMSVCFGNALKCLADKFTLRYSSWQKSSVKRSGQPVLDSDGADITLPLRRKTARLRRMLVLGC